ncbi:alpha/beta hydrolase [Oryzifoliimicrobium ureilyticus]|uniref:alpha/beta hydrolase n=1 Tax=Oryzifoliimicrobium ureilyticus TaxID=3113724 RepID=UPI003075FE9C
MMICILGLHGSSGRPSLIEPFIEELAPAWPRYCPQGTIADGDGFTFFKRRADFSIPPAALVCLARQSLMTNGSIGSWGAKNFLAVGYSSGAIFATALLSVSPHLFAGAILLRPQPISDNFEFPDLAAKPVLILSGQHDERRKPHHAIVLAEQLRKAQAKVTHHDLEAGHAWAGADLTLSRAWLAGLRASN